MGEGRYQWIDRDGTLRDATHWDELPSRMERLVAFVPDVPAPPHTAADHAAMTAIGPKFEQACARCRR